MADLVASEFPFVQSMPKREKSRWAKLMDHWRECKALAEQHGMLIPANLAQDIAGISRQRLKDLIDEGRIVGVNVHGRWFVAEESFFNWCGTERKAGRPLGISETMTLKDQVKMAVNYGKRAAKGEEK